MHKQILDKYSLNINSVCDSVKIYPEPRELNDDWFINIYCPTAFKGGTKFTQIRSLEHNGQKIWLNRQKSVKDKTEVAEKIRDLTIHLLKTNPVVITKMLYGLEDAQRKYPELYGLKSEHADIVTIEEALEEAYKIKSLENVTSHYLKDVRSIKNRFIKHLGGDAKINVILLTKKMCYEFISKISEGRANRTFNNNRTNLQSLLEVLVNKEYINKNYMDLIKPKSKNPKKNIAFSREQIKKLFDLMEDNPRLRFYCMHIYMGLMRCMTANRLKVKHIDLERNIFDTDTKTGKFYKYITQDLRVTYDTLDLSDGDKYVFGKDSLIEEVVVEPETMQGYYGELFRPYKEKLGIPKEKLKDYTLTSFRHSGIGNFWKNKAEELKEEGVADYKNKACEFIMQFTNHTTVNQVWVYLREVDPLLMEDYGKYIKI